MLLVVSPAKNLDWESSYPERSWSEPSLIKETAQLAERVKGLSTREIGRMMALSEKLSKLNYQRFQDYKHPYPAGAARPAVFAFAGDVYQGLGATSLSQPSLDWLNGHLQILSGFYGLLRPFDLILPYRLEMGRSLKTDRGTNLYHFWGNLLTEQLNQQLEKDSSPVLVNLASNEYFKSIKPKLLKAEVYTPQFLDLKKGEYKMISFYAKRARGLMCRYLAENQVDQPEGLSGFNLAGYRFDPTRSSELKPTFIRDQPA